MITIQVMGMAKIQDLQPRDFGLDLIRLRVNEIPCVSNLIRTMEARKQSIIFKKIEAETGRFQTL